jgi:hypothetical protein
MAHPPPCPKTCQNMTRTREVAAKRILASSWGQFASFRAAATRKHVASLRKLTFCPPARPANAHRKIVNKIRNELISSIKITSPHRNHRNRWHDVRQLHLPLKLEPVGAGGSWRSWCRCFYYFWHVLCCVCVAVASS